MFIAGEKHLHHLKEGLFVFSLSKKIERELVAFDDSVVVYGHWDEVDVLAVDTAAIEIHLDNAVEENLIRCLHFSTSASLLLEVQFNKLVVLQKCVDVPIDNNLIQLVVSVL